MAVYGAISYRPLVHCSVSVEKDGNWRFRRMEAQGCSSDSGKCMHTVGVIL